MIQGNNKMVFRVILNISYGLKSILRLSMLLKVFISEMFRNFFTDKHSHRNRHHFWHGKLKIRVEI